MGFIRSNRNKAYPRAIQFDSKTKEEKAINSPVPS
jgi:hypothetical protein